MPAGADSDRPSIAYEEAFAIGAEGGCCCRLSGILGGGGRGGRGGRFAIEPAGRIGDPGKKEHYCYSFSHKAASKQLNKPSILSACRPSEIEELPVVRSAESTSFCIRSASWRRS